MPILVSQILFSKERFIFIPPYLGKDELTRYFLTWYTFSAGAKSCNIEKLRESQLQMGLESIIKNMFFRGGAFCLAKIKNSSGFMFTKFYCRPFTNFRKMTVYRLHNINKTFFEGTLLGCNDLDLPT